MSFEEIKLPDFIIADLYKNSLVELDIIQEEKAVKAAEIKKQEEKQPEDQHEIKFLGKNKKNIAVIVNEPKSLFINEAELDFLTKILTACNLNLADIAIVNFHQQSLDYPSIVEQLKSNYILLLGIEPTAIKLPFSIPPFQVQPFAEFIVFHTPALSNMLLNNQESRLLKSKLWLSLKTAFKL